MLGAVASAARQCGVIRSLATRRAASSLASPEELDRKFLTRNYNPDGVRTLEGVEFVRGRGCRLFDSRGREYVDWAAGIAVNALGHSDPGVAAVVSRQMSEGVQHLSNYYHSRPQLLLAQQLVESTRSFQRVFFCNSGTEANEAALKFARKHALVQAQRASGGAATAAVGSALPPAFSAFACKDAASSSTCATRGGRCDCWPQASGSGSQLAAALRTDFVAFQNGFHGRSMGALATTHKPAIRQPFSAFPADVKFARYNSSADVRRIVDSKTIAVIVEVVQGEGGVVPADAGFLRDVRTAASEAGALVICDEVQTGVGRCGRLWAHEAFLPDFVPDMMTVAKPLANGLPIGAVLLTEAVAASIAPGDHGSTFAGNPLVTSAAVEVLGRISAPGFLEASRVRGRQLLAGARVLQARYPRLIKEVRGTADSGLYVGVELTSPPKPLVQAAMREGLVIITGGDASLRLCPPLVISAAEVHWGLATLDRLIPAVFPGVHAEPGAPGLAPLAAGEQEVRIQR